MYCCSKVAFTDFEERLDALSKSHSLMESRVSPYARRVASRVIPVLFVSNHTYIYTSSNRHILFTCLEDHPEQDMNTNPMHLVHGNLPKGSLYTHSEQSSRWLSPIRAGVGEVGRIAAGEAAAGHGVARRWNEHPTVSVTASAPPASGLGAASPSCRCRRRRLPAATTPASASRHSVLQFVFPSASGNSCKLGIFHDMANRVY